MGRDRDYEDRGYRALQIARPLLFALMIALSLLGVAFLFWKNLFANYATYPFIVGLLPMLLAFPIFLSVEFAFSLHPYTKSKKRLLFPVDIKKKLRIYVSFGIEMVCLLAGIIVSIITTNGQKSTLPDAVYPIISLLYFAPGMLVYLGWIFVESIDDDDFSPKTRAMLIATIALLIVFCLLYGIFAGQGKTEASLFLLIAPLILIVFLSFDLSEDEEEELGTGEEAELPKAD